MVQQELFMSETEDRRETVCDDRAKPMAVATSNSSQAAWVLLPEGRSGLIGKCVNDWINRDIPIFKLESDPDFKY